MPNAFPFTYSEFILDSQPLFYEKHNPIKPQTIYIVDIVRITSILYSISLSLGISSKNTKVTLYERDLILELYKGVDDYRMKILPHIVYF